MKTHGTGGRDNVALQGGAARLRILAAALAAYSLFPSVAAAQSSSWSDTVINPGTYNWSTTSNWTGGIVANGANNTATFNPNAGGGGLASADITVNLDTVRTTASLQQNLVFRGGHVASTLVWGRNKDLTHPGSRIFNGYDLESTVNFKTRNWAWTRIENVDRDQTLLVGEIPAALNVEESFVGRVQAYTFGYERDLPPIGPLNLGIGAQFITYGMPSQFEAVYGHRPQSVVVFLRARPVGNMSAHIRMMHGH